MLFQDCPEVGEDVVVSHLISILKSNNNYFFIKKNNTNNCHSSSVPHQPLYPLYPSPTNTACLIRNNVVLCLYFFLFFPFVEMEEKAEW